MILSDKEIHQALAAKEIEITGVEYPYVGPSSVDLHLDNRAMILDRRKCGGARLHVAEKEKSSDLFSPYDGWEEITIMPGEFYILSTIERLKFPDNMVGFIQGRSSIARMGINIHAAGFFDAGFEGTATLEVTNFTSVPVTIPKGTRICQMVFARMGEKAAIPYHMKKDGKYNGQSGPTLYRGHEDYGANKN